MPNPFKESYSNQEVDEYFDELLIMIIASPEFITKDYKQRVDIIDFLNRARKRFKEE